jgi:hypothetical protein
MAKKVKLNNSAVEKSTVAYIGPTILHVANHGDIFNNGIPNALQAKSEENPLISSLIVDIKDLPAALESLDNKTGKYYAAYIKIKEVL